MKNLGKAKSKVSDHQKSMTIIQENQQNEGLLALDSFYLKYGSVCPWGPSDYIAKVLKDVYE